MEVRFHARSRTRFAIRLQNEGGQFAFATNTEAAQDLGRGASAGRRPNVRDPLRELAGARRRYRLIATVARAGLGADVFDRHCELR